MKAEEAVKQKFPTARTESYKQRGPFGGRYYKVWAGSGQEKRCLGDGDTASKAWTDARRNVEEFYT